MKNGVRFIVFCIVFAVVFTCVQHVFVPKSPTAFLGFNIDPESFVHFYNEPKNSIDILFLGASGVKFSFVPSVIWEETGISCYNLASSGSSISLMYYWLKEALKYQSPRVVVITERSFLHENDFDLFEARFRSGLNDMRWSKNKIDSIMDILVHSETLKFTDFFLPLLRYHDRKDITRDDYAVKFHFERTPTMGANRWFARDIRIIPNDFWDVNRTDDINRSDDFVFENDEYVLKMLDICRNNSIEVIIADTPSSRNGVWSMKKHIAIRDWAKVHDVSFLDYNMQNMWEVTDLDESKDFADRNHLNPLGATKLSRHFAHYVAEEFDLQDRRFSEYDPYWDMVVSTYQDYYNRFAEEVN